MYRRIPLTRGSTLEEAEAAIRAPPTPKALFPFRLATEEDDRDEETPRRPGQSRGTGQHPAGTSWCEGPAAQRREMPSSIGGIRNKSTNPGTCDNHRQPGTSSSFLREEDPSQKKGIIRPRHSKKVQKYSTTFAGEPVEQLFIKYIKRNHLFTDDPDYCHTCLELVGASLARNTWKRYNTALRQWKKFRKDSGFVADLLDTDLWEKKFLIWGWRERGLKVNTLKVYLSELKELGRLARGLATMGNDLSSVLLRGMSNLGTPWENPRPSTKPLTVEILKRIRKGLSKYNSKLTGQSVWTCCVVAFWGAFRLGELLGTVSTRFDKFSSLLWDDVHLSPDSAKIRVKSAKVKGPPGNSVLLFPVPDPNLCPVIALARLRESELNLGMGSKDSPVFRETGGKLLTKRCFLQIVNSTQGEKGTKISGKSFRTGLPSALENFPEIFRDSHVKALGRWRGRSYQTYMKNDTPEFRWVFGQVSSTLINKICSQEKQEDDQTTWTEPYSVPKAKSPRKQRPARTKKRTATRQ